MENLKSSIKNFLMVFGLITIIAFVLGKIIAGVLILIFAGIYLYSKDLYYDILDKLREFGDVVLEKATQIFTKKGTKKGIEESIEGGIEEKTKKNKCGCCSDIEY